VVLSADEIKIFESAMPGQLPGAALFTEEREHRGVVTSGARPVQAAIKNHNRDASVKRRISGHNTAYSFRHARTSELLQIYGVDPLTVAAQTGTVVAMIEKAYRRFIPSAMQENSQR